VSWQLAQLLPQRAAPPHSRQHPSPSLDVRCEGHCFLHAQPLRILPPEVAEQHLQRRQQQEAAREAAKEAAAGGMQQKQRGSRQRGVESRPKGVQQVGAAAAGACSKLDAVLSYCPAAAPAKRL
jgi:hypothetical protein